MVLVRAVVGFCHKKGWNVSRGRPRGERQQVTVAAAAYQRLLNELQEEAKIEEEPASRRFTQNQLRFNQTQPKESAETLGGTLYEPIICVVCQESEGVKYFSCCKGAAHEECWEQHKEKFMGKLRSDKEACWYCRRKPVYLIEGTQ